MAAPWCVKEQRFTAVGHCIPERSLTKSRYHSHNANQREFCATDPRMNIWVWEHMSNGHNHPPQRFPSSQSPAVIRQIRVDGEVEETDKSCLLRRAEKRDIALDTQRTRRVPRVSAPRLLQIPLPGALQQITYLSHSPVYNNVRVSVSVVVKPYPR